MRGRLSSNDHAESLAVAHVMIAMMLGLLPFGWLYLVQRVFYAYEDARTPFCLQVGVTVVATAVTSYALTVDPKHAGIVVGIGQTVSNLAAAAGRVHAAASPARPAAPGVERPALRPARRGLGGRGRPDGVHALRPPGLRHRQHPLVGGAGRSSCSAGWSTSASVSPRPTCCGSRRSASSWSRCCAACVVATPPRAHPRMKPQPAGATVGASGATRPPGGVRQRPPGNGCPPTHEEAACTG